MPGSIVIRENPVLLGEKYHLTLRGADEFTGGATPSFTGYQDDKKSDAGFYSCTFRIQADDLTYSEMFENGLGRGVDVYGEGMNKIFESFIYEMVYNLPPNRYTVSLQNMVNRVQMRADYDADGTVERSTQLDNTDSQNKYGIKEIILSGGQLSSLAVADQATQQFLDIRGFPIPEPDIGGGSGEPYLEIFCRGYIETLVWRVYNQTVSTGNINMSQLIQDVLDSVGQFINSYDLQGNATLVTQVLDADLRARDIISGNVALGDSGNRPWVFYLRENRNAVLKVAAPPTVN